MDSLDNRNRGIGIALVVLGAFFLLAQFVDFDAGRYAWPLFVIIPGVLLLAAMALGGRSAAGLAIPGSIVTTIGLILFVQNLTDRFESWAYAWALITASVGIGQFIMAGRTGDENLRRRGTRLASMGLVMFVLFGAFFELLIFNDFTDGFFGRILLPVLLIGAGAILLLRQRPAGSSPEREDQGQAGPDSVS